MAARTLGFKVHGNEGASFELTISPSTTIGEVKRLCDQSLRVRGHHVVQAAPSGGASGEEVKEELEVKETKEADALSLAPPPPHGVALAIQMALANNLRVQALARQTVAALVAAEADGSATPPGPAAALARVQAPAQAVAAEAEGPDAVPQQIGTNQAHLQAVAAEADGSATPPGPAAAPKPPHCLHRLLYKGQQLADDKTVESYRIESGHTLHLIPAPGTPISTSSPTASAPRTSAAGAADASQQQQRSQQQLTPRPRLPRPLGRGTLAAEEFCCSVTQRVMMDPVTAADGFVYVDVKRQREAAVQ